MLIKQKNKTQVDEILEVVSFIKDNAPTKGEMHQGFSDIRKEMHQGFSDIRKEMHQGFSSIETELQSMREELEDIKKQLKQLDKRTKEDTDVLGKEFMSLSQRVSVLEEKLKRYELARN